MAIQSSLYILDGTTRTFPSSKHIATKQHCAVYGKVVLTNVWEIIDFESYNVVNNSIIFALAPSSSTYSQIEIRVADTQDELAGTLDSISIVASSIIDVNTVASSIENVNNTGGSINNVNTVAADIVNVNNVSTHIGDVISVSSIVADISTVAGLYYPVQTVASISADVSLVASTVSPNIAEILLADENAVTATNAAISCTQSVVSATAARILAEKWASEAENIPVVGSEYSAKHWAAKSLANANEALTKTISKTSSDIGLINSDGSLFVSIPLSNISTNSAGLISPSQSKKISYMNTFSVTRGTDSNIINSYDSTTDTYTPSIYLNAVNAMQSGLVSVDMMNTWNEKQDALVSGTTIKTVNGASLLGSGNLTVTATIGNLDSISDVTITTPADGELLVWDTTTSQWINNTLAEAGIQGYNSNTTIAGNTFNGFSQLVQLDASGKLPAIDGSQLTGITSGGGSINYGLLNTQINQLGGSF